MTTSTSQYDQTYTLMLENYGGVGDWATDNTAAWNAAVAAYGSQSVVLNLDPTKGYYFASSIVVPADWVIDGHTDSPETQNQGTAWNNPGMTWNPTNSRAIAWMKFAANPSFGDEILFGNGSATSQINFVGTVGTQGTGALPSYLTTSAAQPGAGGTLTFASTSGVAAGMSVWGTNIAQGTTVSSVTSTSVVLSAPTSAGIGANARIGFGGNPYKVAIGTTVTATVANLYAFLTGSTAASDAVLSLFSFLKDDFPVPAGAVSSGLQPSHAAFSTLEFYAKARGSAVANYYYGAYVGSSNVLFMPTNGQYTLSGTWISGYVQANLLWNLSVGLGGAILLPATASILYNRGCAFQNMRVINAGIQIPPTGPAMMRAQIKGFSGTAFAPAAGTSAFTPEVTFETIFIGGFNTAISYYGDRLRASFVSHDCTNGINLSGAYEVWEMHKVLANGLLYNGYGYLGLGYDLSYRLGTHIWVHDGGSAGLIDGCFSYGHAAKFVIGNEFGIDVRSCGADGGQLQTIDAPGMLDVTVTAGGGSYSSATAATSTNGDQLAVTVANGSVVAITCVQPAATPAAGAPTITITDPNRTGSGAQATATYTSTINFVTYGSVDRVNFLHCSSDVAGTSMKLGGYGGIVFVTSPLFTGANIHDLTVCAATNASVQGGECGSGLLNSATSYPIYVGANAGSVSIQNVMTGAGTAGIYVDPTSAATTLLWGNYNGGATHPYGVTGAGALTAVSASLTNLTVTNEAIFGNGNGNGFTILNNGGTSGNPGYVGYFLGNGTRVGYAGYTSGSNQLQLEGEGGWSWMTTGAFAVGGALSTAGSIVSTNNALNAWDVDKSGRQIYISGNTAVNLPAGSGLLVVSDANANVGITALFLLGQRSVTLVGSTVSNDFVAGPPSPNTNRIYVYWNSASSCYSIYSGYGAQGLQLGIAMTRTLASN